jgi:hypothetical protein
VSQRLPQSTKVRKVQKKSTKEKYKRKVQKKSTKEKYKRKVRVQKKSKGPKEK